MDYNDMLKLAKDFEKKAQAFGKPDMKTLLVQAGYIPESTQVSVMGNVVHLKGWNGGPAMIPGKEDELQSYLREAGFSMNEISSL